MSEEFDPYLHWLGIRDPKRPPNHYRLLGVVLFEGDSEVISNAADRQMAHVRTFQTGRRSAESQKILNALAGAKVCLLNPQKKAAYDAQLRSDLAVASSPPVASPGANETVVPALPPSLPSSAARRLSVIWATVSALVAMAVVLGALLVFFFSGRPQVENGEGTPWEQDATAVDAGQKDQPPDAPPSGTLTAPRAPTEAKPGPPASSAPKTTSEPPAKNVPQSPGDLGTAAKPSEPAKAEPKPAPKAPAESPLPASKSMEAVRAAMKQRNMADARRHIDLAEKGAYPKDREPLDRLHDVFDPWEAFWKAVRDGIAECKPGDVLHTDVMTAEVVRSDGDGLTVRVAGAERKFTLKDLPAPLALAIAGKKLPENVAYVSKAAFLVVDPQGDARQARQLCEQSANNRVPPGSGLTNEVREALRSKEPAPEPRPAAPTPPSRVAVPDPVAQQAERKNVREVYKARFVQARSPAEKGVLAADLLRDAKETKDNPVARFVLFAEARDLAVLAGDASRLREVVLEMAKEYEVNPLDEQTRALVEASDTAIPSAVRASLAKAALGLAQEAIQADSFDAAGQLAKAGFLLASKVMASKGRDPHAIRQAAELGELVPWYKQQYDLAQQAEKALAQNPNNAKAVQFLGSYYALVKERWDRGLPLLLRGEDPTFKALAESEQAMARAPIPSEVVKLADQWMDASTSIDEPLRRFARRRALYWYENALPRLSGLTKERVSRAVESLKQGDSPRRK